ncbi:uncharacterized protein LOC106070564 isoform X1 [Biomphalaria glabrata]|uniref:Uncharacterized protein LOC106070564 isoform X1 n=1 Tax=Biomphalaria glabrata TaxID=6526 RepID=A0A9W3BLD8_BIOGL|nr:uncharacterized protein LOC106070564 isoform X1 [Biomphalaria glabrata]
MGNPNIFTISNEESFKRIDDQISPTSFNGKGGILKSFPPASNGKINTNPNGHAASENGKLNGMEGLGAKRVRHSIVSIASTVASDLTPDPSLFKRCQKRMSILLHTHVVLIIVSALAALDAICVIGQLICDILIMREKLYHYEQVEEKLTEELFDYIPCLNKTLHVKWNLDAIYAVLTGTDSHFSSTPLPKHCNYSTTDTLDSSGSLLLDMVTGHRAKRAIEPKVPGHEVDHGIRYTLTHIFHLGSLVILSALLLETFLKVFAMGMKLKHHKLEVFDAIVVIISWCLDVALWEGIWAHPGTEAAMLLIYLLPWRVIRIVNSFVLVIQEKDHVQLKIVKQRLRQSLKKNKESIDKTSMYKHELKALAGLCRKLGASDSEINACSPMGKAARRGSVQSVLERAASLTFISTLSSMGSQPSLFDMGDISSEEEDEGKQHEALDRTASHNPTIKSAMSSTTIDSNSAVFTSDTEEGQGVDNKGFKGSRSSSLSSKESTVIQVDPNEVKVSDLDKAKNDINKNYMNHPEVARTDSATRL